jgi:RHS repeat-associated protein
VYVTLGLDPTSASTRYYYVYNAHGDVVNLVDASGNQVASYAYDPWGNLTRASERIPNANGWTNPYRYDGRDGVRYDAADGLYWMSVRAYDPALGRFLAHDPLGRAPLFFADQPYAYAGNNPVSNVDPSGQYRAAGNGSATHESWRRTKRHFARIAKRHGCVKGRNCLEDIHKEWLKVVHGQQQTVANAFSNEASVFSTWQTNLERWAFFIGAIATILAFIPGTQWIAAILYGIAFGLGTLAWVAHDLSDMFVGLSKESIGTNSSIGWFTKAHLGDCVTTCFVNATGMDWVGGLGIFLTAYIAGLSQLSKASSLMEAGLTGEATAAAEAAAWSIAGGLLSGAFIYGMIVAAGADEFYTMVDEFLHEEENAVWA